MDLGKRFGLGLVSLGLLTVPLAAIGLAAPRPAPVADAKVQSILAQRCFACHSEKAQMSGLRLDSRAAALKGGKGGPALLPEDPERSPLLHAIRQDGKLKMPPAGKLPYQEISVLIDWVRRGAPWPTADAGNPGANAPDTKLWAFQPVRNPAVPRVKDAAWVRNPIDAFVLAELQKHGMKPSPAADRRTLIRRVSLDLTGLPPTPEDVEAFVADRAPDAWEKLVDRLLGSRQYGERMALQWLDLARYADSDGYHDDTDRYMWRYRDYVINAFNANKPFDQFTIEQLGGDLIPNATLEQKVASAFNRCGPTSSEGGAIPDEYLSKYAVDRVNTTAGTWLGLTVQCAECHNHKFDPITAKDYYQLFAFFNQVPEEALYRGNEAPPTLLIPNPEQKKRLAELASEVTTLEADLKACGADTSKAAEVERKLKAARASQSGIERLARLRIMADVPERRPTAILVRGDYRNKGEIVQPNVPAALGSLPAGAKDDRLSLARWIVDPKNPLTGRVTVNRYWQIVFGQGLSPTTDDFGTRGERPSHPELLDWLANRFVTGDGAAAKPWDVKALLRLIVTSSTYQQSSRATPAMLVKDPRNRLLARGPRFRLQAELVRDNALAISGLLDRERAVGGPSVKPYQPGDLWRELSAGDSSEKSYVQDHGADLYRRGLYVVWKRSVLYPALSVFDAPKREVCVLRRPITNTPLQAFVTLNDTTYVEAARVFAQRVLARGGVNLDTRLTYAMRVALGRQPTGRERAVLNGIYLATIEQYRADKEAAVKLASAGEAPRAEGLDPVEHAAWTCVCNAILNLDETITKE